MSLISKVEHAVLEDGARQLIFIRIVDEDGMVGYGEATLSGQTEAVRALITTFSDYLVGKPADRVNHHWQHLQRGFWKGGFTLTTALAGVEMALWDLLGKRLGVPLYKLFGGAMRDRIRVYTHLGGNEPAEVRELAAQLVERGWRDLKSFPALSHTPFPADQVPEQLARMQAARDEVGVDVGLYYDCHGRFGFQDALRMARGLADLGVVFIEEPLAPENHDQYKAFCDVSPVPVAMGERLYFMPDFVRTLSEAHIGFMQPDPMRAGGISVTRTVGEMCDARKVKFAPHNSPGTGPVATAASLQLAASSQAFYILEARAELSAAEQAVCSLRLNVQDSHVPLPEGPGLGVELDWDGLTKAPVHTKFMTRGVRVDGTVEDY